MSQAVDRFGLKIAACLHAFIETEVLPGTGIAADDFWRGLAGLFADFGARNRELLNLRDDLQAKIDAYHRDHSGGRFDPADYQQLPARHRLYPARGRRFRHRHRRHR